MSTEVYPVVHIQDTVQAWEQAALAYELGAAGIYLIDHNSSPDSLEPADKLIKAYTAVASTHPDKYIGLNFLQFGISYVSFRFIHDLAAHEEIPRLPDALWVDDASITPEETVELRDKNPELKNVRYLGGISFKYSPLYTDDPAESAREASKFASYVDVVTTSGASTGKATSIEKVRQMKEVIGPQRLALASGVDASNVAAFGEYVDEVLVATSIETAPQSGIFDEAKLRELLAAAS